MRVEKKKQESKKKITKMKASKREKADPPPLPPLPRAIFTFTIHQLPDKQVTAEFT